MYVCPHSFFFSSSSSCNIQSLSRAHTYTYIQSIASLSAVHASRTYSYSMNNIAIIITIIIIIIRINTLLLRCNLLGCLCYRLVVKRTSLRTVLLCCYLFIFVSFFLKFVSLYTLYYIPFHFILFIITFFRLNSFFLKCCFFWKKKNSKQEKKIGFIKLSFVFSVFCYFFSHFFFNCKTNNYISLFLIINRIGFILLIWFLLLLFFFCKCAY